MSQDRTPQESQYRLSVSFIGFYESYLSAYRHRTILAYRSDSTELHFAFICISIICIFFTFSSFTYIIACCFAAFCQHKNKERDDDDDDDDD